MALNGMGLGFTISAKDEASATFSAVGRALGGLEGKGQAAGERFEKMGGELGDLGKKLMGIGAAGLAGFSLASSAAADFGKAVALVQTIADPKEFPVERIRDLGMAMVETYGGDLVGQVNALYNAIGSGASTAAEGATLMNTANKLAVAGASTVDAAMAGLTGTINAYGMKMTDAAQVSDAFFAAVKVGAADMNIDVLSRQFSGVSTIAAFAGVSMNEALASVAKITSVGTSTSVAVTQLKAVIEGILKPSTDATAEAKRLGIQFDQAALKSKGLMGVLNDVTGSAKFNAESFKKLFNSSEAFVGISTLMGDGGDKLKDMLKELEKATGATDAAFETMGGTAAFAASQLKGNMQKALVLVGEAVAPILGTIAKSVNAVLVAFNNLPAPVRSFLVQAAAVASIAAVVAGAILTAVGAVMAFAATVGEAAVTAAAVAAAIAAGLGLVVAAGEGFRLAIEKNVGGIGVFFREAWASAKLAYNGLVQLFTDGGLSGAVLEGLNAPGREGLKTFVIELFGIGSRIMMFFDGLKSAVVGGIGNLATPFENLKSALGELFAAFGLVKTGAEGATDAWNSAGDSGRTVGSFLASAFGFVVDAITTTVSAFASFVSGFRSAIGQGAAFKNLFVAVGNLLSTVATIFGVAGTSANDGASGINGFAQALGFVVGAIAQVITVGANLMTTMIAINAGVLSSIFGIVSGVISAVGGMVNVVAGILSGDWSRAWLGAKEIVFGVFKAIVSAIGAVASVIGAVLDKIGHLFGRDMGAQRGAEGIKNTLVRGLETDLGLGKEQRAETTAANAPPPPRTGPAAPLYTPPAPGAPGGPAAAYGAGVPPGQPIPPSPGAPTAPATAAAGGQGDATAAINALGAKLGAPQPVNVQTQTTLTVDGAVLAETVDRYSTAGANRAFGATPAPT